MRKPEFCLCKNKGADQLCSNCTADQCFCFSLHAYYNSSATYNQTFKIVILFCDCTDQFVPDLVVNPKDRLSRVAAFYRLKTIDRNVYKIFERWVISINIAFFKLPLSCQNLFNGDVSSIFGIMHFTILRR